MSSRQLTHGWWWSVCVCFYMVNYSPSWKNWATEGSLPGCSTYQSDLSFEHQKRWGRQQIALPGLVFSIGMKGTDAHWIRTMRLAAWCIGRLNTTWQLFVRPKNSVVPPLEFLMWIIWDLGRTQRTHGRIWESRPFAAKWPGLHALQSWRSFRYCLFDKLQKHVARKVMYLF